MAILVKVVNVNDDKGVPDIEIELSMKGTTVKTTTNNNGTAFFALPKGNGNLYIKQARSYLLKNDFIGESVTILYKPGGFWGDANFWIP